MPVEVDCQNHKHGVICYVTGGFGEFEVYPEHQTAIQ